MRFIVGTIAMVCAVPATAASIVWQAPVTVSQTTDIFTGGTLHAAMAAAGPVTVNGVAFGSYNSQASLLQGSGLIVYPGPLGAPNLADSSYNALLNRTAYVGGMSAPDAIQIGALTPGTSYVVQIWQPFWDKNWATSYVAGNASDLVDAAGIAASPAPATSRPEYVLGSFVASSANQNISFQGPTGIVMFAAVQVRAATLGGSAPAVPEPASWAMLIAGFGLTGAAMRRRRLVRG